MKLIYYFLLLLLSSCSTAQNIKILEAGHYTRIGGVKGSKAEIFEIKIQDDSKLNIQYLQLGEVKIPLSKQVKNGMQILTATYFPENPQGPQVGEIASPKNLDYNNAHLLIENNTTKKIFKQKITFQVIENPIKNDGDVPE